MLEECIVKKVVKGRAYVGLSPSAECEGCKACIFGKNKDKVDVPAVMEVECRAGDTVLVDLPKREIVAAPIYLYLMPLFCMLIGFLIGNYISLFVQIILGFGFLILSFAVMYLIDRLYFASKRFSPKVIKIIKENNIKEIDND